MAIYECCQNQMKVPVDSGEVIKWPETIAFLNRLGLKTDNLVTLVIAMGENECVTADASYLCYDAQATVDPSEAFNRDLRNSGGKSE
jgi:hypothetical protein